MDLQETAVYCTLLLSDNYLPGAMVLAHSLRDNGTTAKLAALFTPDTLQPATIDELQAVYDEIIPVQPIANQTPANLWLMDRPDLVATFTKIELWRQTQFQRIVYIDCDVVAVRAPDELLSLDVTFGAAPDVGWPDCFNSGVMVLRPNLQDYHALRALAENGVSFDGADQGLLNLHFADGCWHRLGFGYNCTPSANYQYIPAYKHYGRSISLIHFIGSQKPWDLPRWVVPVDSPYNQLLGRWWSVYDRHYRPASVPVYQNNRPITPQDDYQDHQMRETMPSRSLPELPEPLKSSEHIVPQPVQDTGIAVHPEQLPHIHGITPDPGTLPSMSTQTDPEHYAMAKPNPTWSAVPQYVRGEEHVSAYVQHPDVSHTKPMQEPRADRISTPLQSESHQQHQPAEPEPVPKTTPEPETPIFEPPMSEWDASREPPPPNSKPEAITLQQQTYAMSEDTRLFQPPESYPEAPRNMYYKVPPTKPEPEQLAQVFPWEGKVPKPTRVFAEPTTTTSSTGSTHEQAAATITDEENRSSTATATSWPWPATLTSTSAMIEEPTDSFENYTRSNAWDEVPEIQQHVESIQKAREEGRKRRGQIGSGSGSGSSSSSTPPMTTTTEADYSDLETSRLTLTPVPSVIRGLESSPSPSPSPDNNNNNNNNRNSRRGREDNIPITTTPATRPVVPFQDEWTALTAHGFLNILQMLYLYWAFTATKGKDPVGT